MKIYKKQEIDTMKSKFENEIYGLELKLNTEKTLNYMKETIIIQERQKNEELLIFKSKHSRAIQYKQPSYPYEVRRS